VDLRVGSIKKAIDALNLHLFAAPTFRSIGAVRS
jgi:hypothetical protein